MKATSVVILSHLQMLYVGDGFYRLTSPFRFRVTFDDNSTRLFEIHEDFVTDLHSVPWLVRVIFRFSCYVAGMNKGAAGHDYLYRFLKVLRIPRRVADQIYLLLCHAEVDGLPEIERMLKRNKAFIMYRAVRRFGWMAGVRGDGTPPKRVAEKMKELGL